MESVFSILGVAETVLCINTSFLFIILSNVPRYGYVSLFNHSPIEENFDFFFLFGAIINKSNKHDHRGTGRC